MVSAPVAGGDMTSPNFRLSPAAGKVRHHDDARALALFGAVIGASIVLIIIAAVILVAAAQ